MSPERLLRLALRLAEGAHGTKRGRPDPVELKRAVSTIYYALFHALAQCVADRLAGPTTIARNRPAWVQAYRCLNHGSTRNQCNRKDEIKRFPSEVQAFATMFVNMQKRRNEADYDPKASFARVQVVQWVHQAELAVANFNRVSTTELREFAVYVALPPRRR